MLDSLVRVSRRVDNPLLQKWPLSEALLAPSLNDTSIPFFSKIYTFDLKLNRQIPPTVLSRQ